MKAISHSIGFLIVCALLLGGGGWDAAQTDTPATAASRMPVFPLAGATASVVAFGVA